MSRWERLFTPSGLISGKLWYPHICQGARS